MNNKMKKYVKPANSFHALDKTNSTLFISGDVITKYINNNVGRELNNLLTYSLKERDGKKVEEIIKNIIQKINEKGYKLVFFIYNCSFIQQFMNILGKTNLDIQVIAWHQKHYFNPEIVPKLYAVVEYSKIQARKEKKYNHQHDEKYIYIPYPIILDSDYHQKIHDLKEPWMERYVGKYVFCGGNNSRDFKQMINLAIQNKDINFIILCSNPKSVNRLHKHIKDDQLTNLTYYTDTDSFQFAYAIQQCNFMVMPFIKASKMAGHSVIAQSVYFGKPTISNINCSMDEAIEHEKTGYLVNIKDNEAYQKYTRQLWDDESLCQKMSEEVAKNSYVRSFAYYESELIYLAKKALFNEKLE